MPEYKPKTSEPVEAFQVAAVNAPVNVKVNGAITGAAAGDYLVRAEDGTLSVMKKADFEGFYAPVEVSEDVSGQA